MSHCTEALERVSGAGSGNCSEIRRRLEGMPTSINEYYLKLSGRTKPDLDQKKFQKQNSVLLEVFFLGFEYFRIINCDRI